MNTHSTSPQLVMTSDYQVMPGKKENSNNNLPPHSAIDRDILNRLRAELGTIAPGLVDELIELYIANSPGLLTQMRQGIMHGDTETVKIAAHTLKSNSARLGATVCSQLCQTLELMGQNEQLDDASEKLDELELEFQRVEKSLHTA